MGKKWTAFKTKLPRLVPAVDWQTKVDQAKVSFKKADHRALARRLRQVKAEKDELESQIKAINVVEEALSQLLLDWMEQNGTDKISLADGTLYVRDEPYVRIADREALIQWLKKNKHEDLLSVHWQTLNALVKERMIAGQVNPAGCEVFMKTTVSLRKE